jgi:hypothetical protein
MLACIDVNFTTGQLQQRKVLHIMINDTAYSCSDKIFACVAYLICLPILCLLNMPYQLQANDTLPIRSPESPRLSIKTTSSAIPGELKETNIATESIFAFKPGWSWQTTTNFSGMRHNSLMPFRSENSHITTGPQLKIGSTNIFFPLQTGYEIATGAAHMTWVSSSPGLKINISSKDSMQIDTGFKTRRTESLALQNVESSKSVGLSWRHNFDDYWSMRIGLERRVDAASMRSDNYKEGFARVTARLSNDWWWTLSGSIAETLHNTKGQADYSTRDTFSTLSISTRYVLSHGWEISGTFSESKNQVIGETGSSTSRKGSVKLYKGF